MAKKETIKVQVDLDDVNKIYTYEIPKRRKFKIVLVSTSPYMQHRMDDVKLQEWEKKRKKIIEREGLDITDYKQALYHSYNDEKGFYIPSEHFKQSFILAGATVKSKMGTSSRSLKPVIAGGWQIEESKLYIQEFDEVDIRSAVNNNVKARITTKRPKWNKWEVSIHLITDDLENPLTVPTIHEVVSTAGRYIGIGSYRPQHVGEFGRFTVKSMQYLGEI